MRNPTERLTKLKSGFFNNFEFERVSKTAGIYLSAVLDSVTNQLCGLIGDSCVAEGLKVVKPRHILQAIREDEDFSELLKEIDILGGVGDYAPLTSFGLKDLTEQEVKEQKEKKKQQNEEENDNDFELEAPKSDNEEEQEQEEEEKIPETQPTTNGVESDEESGEESEKDLIGESDSDEV